ncbi:hypothetical protein [Candidatus Vidania fulgoroideorum]
MIFIKKKRESNEELVNKFFKKIKKGKIKHLYKKQMFFNKKNVKV